MNDLVNDWKKFCNGKEYFDKSHFYTLFWENINESDLKMIFKFFPNSDKLYKIMYKYLFEKINLNIEYSTQELIIFAMSDFEQKKQILPQNHKLHSLFNGLEIEFVNDYKVVEKSLMENPYSEFYDAISDIIFDNWVLYDKKTYALDEAFYGLTKDYQITWHLFNPLLKVDIDLENYLKLSCAGGIYSISDKKLIVARKKTIENKN